MVCCFSTSCVAALEFTSPPSFHCLLLSPLTQEGKFGESSSLADAVFVGIPLVVAASKADAAELKAALKVATEYKTAVRIMLTARAHDAEDAVRQMELAALMTHCALEPAHLMLALNLAMSVCYKFQNFIHAAGFARRLLELPDINSARNAALNTKVGGGGVARSTTHKYD